MTNNEQSCGKPDLFNQWHRGIRLWHIAHAKAAANFRRRGRLLGVPVVILTTIVGTSIFATISEQAISDTWKIIAGLMSGLAAVLAALQTFLNYGVLAEKHNIASIAFGALRRDLERALDTSPHGGETRAQVMQAIGDRWAEIEREAPIVPTRIHRQAAKQVGAPQVQDD